MTTNLSRDRLGQAVARRLRVLVRAHDASRVAAAAHRGATSPAQTTVRRTERSRQRGSARAMATLPSGTVTFVFSDIEGSTALVKRLGDRYGDVLADHRRLMREALGERGGVEIDTQGDAFFFAFARARDAVAASVEAQRAHAAHAWPEEVDVRMRMGLHTGEPAVGEEGDHGLDVVRAARLCSAAAGGSVLLSETTRALVGSAVPEGVAVHPIGERRLWVTSTSRNACTSSRSRASRRASRRPGTPAVAGQRDRAAGRGPGPAHVRPDRGRSHALARALPRRRPPDAQDRRGGRGSRLRGGAAPPCVQAAGVAGEAPVRADDAVAGQHDRDRVGFITVPTARAARGRPPGRQGAVRRHLAERHERELASTSRWNGAPAEVEREVEVVRRPSKYSSSSRLAASTARGRGAPARRSRREPLRRSSSAS